MNKSELIAAMSEHSGLSKTDSKKALEGFTKAITTSLSKGDRITSVEFESFSISHKATRKDRGPKEIKIAAKNVVRFKKDADLSSKVK